MTILNFKDFLKKYKLKKNTMNETQLQTVYNYPTYPKNSKKDSDIGFVNIDNGAEAGTHWTCFLKKKDNKSYYFDSFGGQPDKLLLSQLPKPITYHNFKIQDVHSNLCGSYCLYLFYLIERMNYYNALIKMYFQ